MDREITPREIRDLAKARRVARDPFDHIRSHGFRLADIITALEHCFRVRWDARSHRGRPPSPNAFRADCHYTRGQRLRVDFNLTRNDEGQIILVVTAFTLGA